MDKLLEALAELETFVGSDVVGLEMFRGDRRQQLAVLEEVWPDELEYLCQHVELLKLLVWVCDGSTSKGRCR